MKTVILMGTDDLRIVMPVAEIKYATETEEGIEYQVTTQDDTEFDVKGDIRELLKAMGDETPV